jgi:hypothetical protein
LDDAWLTSIPIFRGELLSFIVIAISGQRVMQIVHAWQYFLSMMAFGFPSSFFSLMAATGQI